MMALRIASLVCAVGVASLGWAIVAATRKHSTPTAVATTSRGGASRVQRADTATNALIDSALARNPFSSSREGGPKETSTVVAHAEPAADIPHLLGTVLDSIGGSFALCQLGAHSAQVVRVGQALGAYELRSVSQGTAVFVAGDGQRLELRVPKTGS